MRKIVFTVVFSLTLMATLSSCITTNAEMGESIAVAGDASGYVYAFEASSGTLLWSVNLGGDTRGVAISDDGRFIVVGTTTKLALLDWAGRILWVKDLGVHWVDRYDTRVVSISSDGTYIIAAHIDGTIRLYNRWGSQIWSYSFGSCSVAISGDGRSAAAVGDGGLIFFSVGANGIWDPGDSNPKWGPVGVSYRKVAISQDGRYIAVGESYGGYARLYDDEGTEIWTYKVSLRPEGGIVIVDISRDGRRVVAGVDDPSDSFGAQLVYFWIGSDGDPNSWSLGDGTPVWSFRASKDPHDDVRSVVFSPDGEYIASGGAAGYSYTFLHRVDSSTPIYQSQPWGLEDETIGFDGRYIITADIYGPGSNVLRLYDTWGSNQPLWTYTTNGIVRSVAISRMAPMPVGGELEPLNIFAFMAPWITLTLTVTLIGISILTKTRKRVLI
jgi:WD40 repeat protein